MKTELKFHQVITVKCPHCDYVYSEVMGIGYPCPSCGK